MAHPVTDPLSIAPDPVWLAMTRTFATLSAGGHFAASWLVCDWAQVMSSARHSCLPAVKADRLRSAAEFRAEIAREKGRG